MPDNTDIFFTNDYETLALKTGDSGDDLVAGIKNVTIELSYGTFERFYTADSTKRAASKQAELAVPVSIEYAFFDPTFVEEWMGGDGTTATGPVEDTSDPQDFILEGNFRSRDGDKEIDITVEGINFDTIPVFDGSENEIVVWGLDGEGSDITNFTGGTVA